MARAGCGLVALALGALAGLAYLVLLFGVIAGGPVDAAVVAGSLAWLAAGTAAVLLGAGIAAAAADHAVFRPARPGPWLVLLLTTLAAGSLVLALGTPLVTAALFPPLHVAAALAPALSVAAVVAWRSGRPAWLTWRGVVRQLGWGAGVATAVALAVEVAVGLVLVGVVYLLLGQSDGGRALVDAAAEIGRLCTLAPEPATDCEARINALLLDAVVHPPVVVAVFAMVGVVGPIVEELAKAAGVALGRPASRGQAWAWGAVTGAGFGILEAVMFGALGLNLAAWAVTLLVRACATLMHATMTGLAGVGAYAAVAERDVPRAAAHVGAAIVGHAAWNALAFVAVLAALLAEARDAAWLGIVASLAAFGVIVLFNTIFLGFLGLSARYGAGERAGGESAESASRIG